jgi:hypothetical protein
MSDCEYDIALFFIRAVILHPAQSRPKSHFAYRSYVFLSGRAEESDFPGDYTSYRQQVLDGSSYKTLRSP